LLLVTIGVGLATPGHPVRADGSGSAPRPNILLIMADDMAATDLHWMPQTRRLLGESGVRVEDFLSNHPLCCPARAEILTGQYGQHNGVRHNRGPRGGYRALIRPGNTVASWLQDAGYRTAFVGKYLNGWEKAPRHEPGWTSFDAMVRRLYAYYGVTMYRDGSPRTYPDTHSNDVVSSAVVRYVRTFSASRAPFFIWAAPVAPHDTFVRGRERPPIPAARHRRLKVPGPVPAVEDPSFDEVDVSDKVRRVAERPGFPVATARHEHVQRIRSLRSVDDLVGRAVRTLRRTGEHATTYVFFTSDNGYLIGQHRLMGKNVPYEPALLVPFLVRGPGLPPGTVRSATFGMVDLAPTFLDIAGGRARRLPDGRSMLAALRGQADGYADYLIQGGGDGGAWWWRGVRSHDVTYVRFGSGFEELYDRTRDPDELDNVATDPAYADLLRRYESRLEVLESCQGTECLSTSR
jgi:arylsulfatase A-like enzyme